MLKAAKTDQETFGKGQQIKKGVQQWSLVLSSLICCLLNNKSQASCDFMVLNFPSNILVKMLALLRIKWTTNQPVELCSTYPTHMPRVWPIYYKTFSQSQAAALREAQPCEFCTFNPPCLCSDTAQCKHDFVQNIPNLATVMFNLWSNSWLMHSTRVRARDEQANKNQNELKKKIKNTIAAILNPGICRKDWKDQASIIFMHLNVH